MEEALYYEFKKYGAILNIVIKAAGPDRHAYIKFMKYVFSYIYFYKPVDMVVWDKRCSFQIVNKFSQLPKMVENMTIKKNEILY